MKKNNLLMSSLVAAVIFIVLGFVYESNPSDIINIGDKAPNTKLKMEDVSERIIL